MDGEKQSQQKLFTSWTSLSFDLVHKYLSKKQSTTLGHLHQPQKFLRSTQEKVIQPDPDPEQDQLPSSTQSEDTNIVFLKRVDITGKNYTDQTGRFPVTSSKGITYILVTYNYESNNIHAEPLKTRSSWDLKTALPKTPQLIYQQRVETSPTYPVK